MLGFARFFFVLFFFYWKQKSAAAQTTDWQRWEWPRADGVSSFQVVKPKQQGEDAKMHFHIMHTDLL